MTTKKCEYCLNNFRVLKQHQLRCKSKIEYDKNQLIKQSSSKKFDENYDIQNNNNNNKFKINIDILPDDLLYIIKSYIISDNPDNEYKDRYCSYYKLYKQRMNYCYISKKLYNIFYPKYEDIMVYKKNLKDERETRICKTTAKTDYGLKENELEDEIDYDLYHNPHYRSSPPMKLYQIRDILDYMAKKYGTYENHMNQLEEIKIKKALLKEKRDILQEKRKENIEKLFDSYDVDISPMYNKYYDEYINKGSPGLKTIKEEIQIFIGKEKRKNEIKDMLDKNSWQKYRKEINNIILDYIDNNINTCQYIFETIQNIHDRDILLNNLFLENNLSLNELTKDLIHGKLINDFIYNNNGSPETIVNIFVDKTIRKQEVNDKLTENNINNKKTFKNATITKRLNDYIELNIGNIDEIIAMIIEKNNRKIELEILLQNNNILLMNMCNRICLNYIDNGIGNINTIVDDIIINNFYRKYTTYNYEMRKLTLSTIGQKIALKKWCILNESYEKAIENTDLPQQLYGEVHKIYEENDMTLNTAITTNVINNNNNNNKHSNNCLCGNMGAIACGMCSKCCTKIDCYKHKKSI